MAVDRLERVLRTGGIITAGGGKQRGNEKLVAANSANDDCSQHSRNRGSGDVRRKPVDFETELLEGGTVAAGSCPNDDVERRHYRKHAGPGELAETSFEEISFDGGFPVTRNDDSNTRMILRGAGGSHFEMLCRESLPGSPDTEQIGFTRQPNGAGEPEAIRRRRTSSEAER